MGESLGILVRWLSGLFSEKGFGFQRAIPLLNENLDLAFGGVRLLAANRR
jgi:hypothetical protein